MKRIKFRFKDKYTDGKWKNQECSVESLEECVRIYGLNNPDVDWELVMIEDKSN